MEILVVIAVIAILISILGVTLSHMGQQAKEAATNTTIKKIHVLLDQRIEAFGRAMIQVERNPGNDPDYTRAFNFVDKQLRDEGAVASSSQLKILIQKRIKRLNFPQTFEDAGLDRTLPKFNNHELVSESSEMLYFMLTQGRVGGAAPVDAGEFLASEVADTDGDGLLEFVDAWGNPLRFYRWPTRLFKSNGTIHTDPDIDNPDDPDDHTNANLLDKGLRDDLVDTDPDDPLKRLKSVIDGLPDRGELNSFEDLYHTPNTYHLPLIVSAGPDGALGLREPTEKDVENNNFGYLAQPDPNLSNTELLRDLSDNMTNRNQLTGD